MLNTTVASASFNLTSIEKKLAAIETLNSTSFVPKPPTRLTKVNNESELDAHLKSERTLFNDQQFDYLTQQSLTQADTDYWEEIFVESLKCRRNLINCLLADDLRPRSITSYDSTSTNKISIDPVSSSTHRDLKSSNWSSQQVQTSIFADLSSVEQQYAQTLIQYNQTRTSSETHGDIDQLIRQYQQVSMTSENQAVSDLWHSAQWMSNVLDYDYRKTDLFCSQRAVVLCARNYLEQSFRQAIETTYGEVDFHECLVSFIRSNEKIAGLQSVDDRLVDGVSAWPLIFYALRAGDTDLALNIIQKANLPHVQNLLESYQSKEERNPAANVSTISTSNAKSSNLRNIEYSLVGNPYKRAVICILDRTNLVDAHEDVLLCVEDFLWIKLAQIPIHNENAFQDRVNVQLTIPRLQRWIIRDLGEEYFKAVEQPFRYARILVLCGAFESACEFLFKLPTTKVHSIHLAIYLNEKCLLGLISATEECMIIVAGNSQQNRNSSQLNLPKLIGSYLREKFLDHQHRYWELINYAYALTNIENTEADNEFRRLLIDLTTNLDDLHLVYGRWAIVDQDEDGNDRKTLKLQPGLLHRLLAQQDQADLDELFTSLATTIEEHHHSNLLVAATLYELAGDYQSAVSIGSKYISQLILDRLLMPSSAATPLPFVYDFAQRLQIHSTIDENNNYQEYFLLLDIYSFVDFYFRLGQHERAFLILKQIKLFPYGKDPEEDQQARKLFTSNPQLQQLFPHLCLAALRTHLLVIQQNDGTSLNDEERNQYEYFRRTASQDLIHLAEFAHMQSQSFTRTQLRSIDRLCEQANQYHHDHDMSFH